MKKQEKKSLFEEAYFHISNSGMTLTIEETRQENATLRAAGAPSYCRSFALKARLASFGSGISIEIPLGSRAIVKWLIEALERTLQAMDTANGWQPDFAFSDSGRKEAGGGWVWKEKKARIMRMGGERSDPERADAGRRQAGCLTIASWLASNAKVGDWVTAEMIESGLLMPSGHSAQWEIRNVLQLAAGPIYVNNTRETGGYQTGLPHKQEYRMTDQLLKLPALIEAEFASDSD